MFWVLCVSDNIGLNLNQYYLAKHLSYKTLSIYKKENDTFIVIGHYSKRYFLKRNEIKGKKLEEARKKRLNNLFNKINNKNK